MASLISGGIGLFSGLSGGYLSNEVGNLVVEIIEDPIDSEDNHTGGVAATACSVLATLVSGKVAVLTAPFFLCGGPFIAGAKLGAIAITATHCATQGNKNFKNGAVCGIAVGLATAIFFTATAGLVIGGALGYSVAHYQLI